MAATSRVQAQELSNFYASLVETSGERWADAAPPPAPPPPTAVADREPEGVTVLPPGQSYQAPAGPVTRERAQRQAAPPRLAIASSNVGYQLLKKAGWTEGQGIGLKEQGDQEPLQAHMQQGNLGLGFAKPQRPGGKRNVSAPSADAAAGPAGLPPRQPPRALPPDELAEQSVEDKVKRVRQVMQAEADDEAGKAIARYIYSAFSETTGAPTRDTNPLLRRDKRTSATNPLL